MTPPIPRRLYSLLRTTSRPAPRARGMVVGMVLAAAVVTSVGVARVAHRHQVVKLGFELADASAQLHALQDENHQLLLRRSVLTEPGRIRALASALGMQLAAPDAIRVVPPAPEAASVEDAPMTAIKAPRARRPRTPRPLTPGLSRGARIRAYSTAAVMTLLFAAIADHAWGIEVRDADHYRALADRQHVRTLEVAAPRGAILDLRGRALAVTAQADSVFANPREVRDVAATADTLARLLGLDVNELEDKLSSERHFTWIARLVTPAQARAVRGARLPGVGVTPEPQRSYPGGAASAPVLGLAGIDGKGLDGAELSLDELLVGRRARFEAVRDARGKTLLEDGLSSAAPGATVTLTIDRTVQGIAATALADGVKDNQARAGAVVVIEIGTGRVLAMASAPTHDPGRTDGTGPRAVRDHAVADAYELGSVMKPFTIATALEDGVTTPDHVWDVENGAWRLGHKVIRDVDRDPVLTTGEVIKRSSNIGAAKIGLKLGRERLHDGLVKFGFGQKTGIELPGEQSGMLRDGRSWRDIETATISFGYGLTVTPLQLAAAIATFAQGGRYVPPTIVERINGPGGVLIRVRTPMPRRAVSEKTASQVLAMLRSVFDGGKHGGTAKHLVVPGFACGGKTGTAHK